MNQYINPFEELYVTETLTADQFVDLFSPVLVDHALSLFQPGHVILKGHPGSGKSMILNLLKPEIRLAYEKSRISFPVPNRISKFFGAGIHLKLSGASALGERLGHQTLDQQEQMGEKQKYLIALYFGDFLNYFVVSDILSSVRTFMDVPESKVSKHLGITHTSYQRLDDFAREVASNDRWFGYLNKVKDFESLVKQVNRRVAQYRALLNYNLDEAAFYKEIEKSKTTIGAPISLTANKLREFNIVSRDVEIYVRIDQYEELLWIANYEIGQLFQEVINKLLGSRDKSVSYRVGTRSSAWQKNEPKKMHGTSARLEKDRNYKIVEIEMKLRRDEGRQTWLFPSLVEDIFKRRMSWADYSLPSDFRENDKTPLLKHTFGGLNKLKLSALDNLSESSRNRIIEISKDWPKNWVAFLNNLAQEDPFSAKLAEAWARQAGDEKKAVIFNIPDKAHFPWETHKWWKKERTNQALMQIASKTRRPQYWGGKDDLIGLSGGNILAFLSLCQHIWDAWQRSNRGMKEQSSTNSEVPKIEIPVQTIGINECSTYWYDSISNQTGGPRKQRFISYLGRMFYKELIDDKAMKYPGYNGFSLRIDETQSDSEVHEFIKDATEYGDLYCVTHSSKEKGEKRAKWYLNPILSPYFKIPYSHTKEPMYVNVSDVRDWLIRAKAISK